MGLRLSLLLTLLLAASRAPANDVVETAAQYYAAWELQQGGDGFYGRFLEFGWPTDPDYQQLTSALADRPAADVLSGLLASGAGISLSATREVRGDDGKGGAKVASIMAKYRTQAGLTASLPAAFDPTCIPALRSRQQLVRAFRASDLDTWRWVEAPNQFALEGLGYAMLSEAGFVKEQLMRGDPTPEHAFFAYLALHSALAKASELPHLIFDTRRQRIDPVEGPLLDLDEHRYHFANSWTRSTVSSSPN